MDFYDFKKAKVAELSRKMADRNLSAIHRATHISMTALVSVRDNDPNVKDRTITTLEAYFSENA